MAEGTGLAVIPLPDFGFGFDDVNFSDRVMRIEIIPGLPGSEPDPDRNNRKRRRECDDTMSNTNAINANGAKAAVANDDETVLVRTVHISSIILAAKSPFFFKLFSNGMMESEQRHVTLRIQVSEEAALMDLLNFMYSNTLPRTTPASLLDVLMAADKFEVASCLTYCSQLLLSLPMTLESALFYLDLPCTVLVVDTVKQLADDARKFLATSFKDISKHEEEVMKLPLVGIETLVSSDDLQVASEDVIYDIVLKWARLNYPNLEERREILSKRLLGFVRFAYMSCRNIKKVLTCGDIDPELASKVVMEALLFKAEVPYRESSPLAKERWYNLRDVKVVEFKSPWKHCVVYMDLKREECAQLFPDGLINSQTFWLGGQSFVLSVSCQNGPNHYFELLLSGAQENGSVAMNVNYEFAARLKSEGDFKSLSKGRQLVREWKYHNVWRTPWTSSFMPENSPYFINGVFHLRAEFIIK